MSYLHLTWHFFKDQPLPKTLCQQRDLRTNSHSLFFFAVYPDLICAISPRPQESSVHTIQYPPFWLICLLYDQTVLFHSKHNFKGISLIEMSWSAELDRWKLVSENGKGTWDNWGKGVGKARRQWGRGRAGCKPAAANSNNAQETRLLPTKLFLTFQLSTTIARLKIWSTFGGSSKILRILQSPIVQLGDIESHSSENYMWWTAKLQYIMIWNCKCQCDPRLWNWTENWVSDPKLVDLGAFLSQWRQQQAVGSALRGTDLLTILTSPQGFHFTPKLRNLKFRGESINQWNIQNTDQNSVCQKIN